MVRNLFSLYIPLYYSNFFNIYMTFIIFRGWGRPGVEEKVQDTLDGTVGSESSSDPRTGCAGIAQPQETRSAVL